MNWPNCARQLQCTKRSERQTSASCARCSDASFQLDIELHCAAIVNVFNGRVTYFCENELIQLRMCDHCNSTTTVNSTLLRADGIKQNLAVAAFSCSAINEECTLLIIIIAKQWTATHATTSHRDPEIGSSSSNLWLIELVNGKTVEELLRKSTAQLVHCVHWHGARRWQWKNSGTANTFFFCSDTQISIVRINRLNGDKNDYFFSKWINWRLAKAMNCHTKTLSIVLYARVCVCVFISRKLVRESAPETKEWNGKTTTPRIFFLAYILRCLESIGFRN